MRFIAAIVLLLGLVVPTHVLAATPQSCTYGDVNCDGDISIGDVQCAILTLIKHPVAPTMAAWSWPPQCLADVDPGDWIPNTHTVADLNCDNEVSVVDAVLTVNLAVSGTLNSVVDADGDNVVDACLEVCLDEGGDCGGIGFECTWDGDASLYAVLNLIQPMGQLKWKSGVSSNTANGSGWYNHDYDAVCFVAVEASHVPSEKFEGAYTWQPDAFHEQIKQSCLCKGSYPWLKGDPISLVVPQEASGIAESWWVYEELGTPDDHVVGCCLK